MAAIADEEILLRGDIGHMVCAVLPHPTPMWRVDSIVAADGYGAKMRARNHRGSFNEPQRHIINPTNSCSNLDDRIQRRLHVRRRAADNAEHLGRCRLMLQRLGELTPAILRLFD